MIDLAAVAAKINALEGWTAKKSSDWEEVGFIFAGDESGAFDLDITTDGEVLAGEMTCDLMPLLPVLQIVAEAMAHE